MKVQSFIDIVAADIQRIDRRIGQLEHARRFAAHMIDAAETFKRNNSPTPAELSESIADNIRKVEEIMARLNAKATH